MDFDNVDTEAIEDAIENHDADDWMDFGMALGLGHEIGINEAEILRDLDEMSRDISDEEQLLLAERSLDIQAGTLLPTKCIAHDFEWACAQIERMIDDYDK